MTLASGSAIVLGLLLLSTNLGGPLQRLSFDLTFLFRNDRPADEALIVYMDEPSRNRLDQPSKGAWSHRLHARLVDALREAGAKTIVFNEGVQGDGATDAFAAAIRRHGNVILAAELATAENIVRSQTLMRPERILEEAAAGLGLASFLKDVDQAKRFYDSTDVGELEVLSDSLAHVAAKHHSAPRVPAAPRRFFINYYGPPFHIPNRSYETVLINTNLAPIARGKLVFVGSKPTAGFLGEMKDSFATPYTRFEGAWSSGVEVHATAALNMLRGDWIAAASSATAMAWTLGLGLVAGLVLVNLRPWRAVAIGVLAAAGLVAAFISTAITDRTWFPFLIPVVVQIPAALAVALVGHSLRISRDHSTLLAEHESLTRQVTEASGDRRSADSSVQTDIGPAPITPRNSDTVSTVAGPAHDDPRRIEIPDYELIKVIGRGAFGEVWLAKTLLGAWRAVKVIHASRASGRTAFDREYEGVRQFDPVSRRHPNLVDILHLGRDPGLRYFYYVLELADPADGSLSVDPGQYTPRSLGSDISSGKRYDAVEFLALSIPLASGLDFLHRQNLIHRDIKPANIIFVEGTPKLADVGLVTSASQAHTFVGTYGYIPPEGPGSPQADIFSLGRVFQKMIFGKDNDVSGMFPPADTLSDAALESIGVVLEKATAVDPGERFRSAGDLLKALRNLNERLLG